MKTATIPGQVANGHRTRCDRGTGRGDGLLIILGVIGGLVLAGLTPRATGQSPYRLEANDQPPAIMPPHASFRVPPTRVPPRRFFHWDLREFPGCSIPYAINDNGHNDAHPGNEFLALRRAGNSWSLVFPKPLVLSNVQPNTVTAVAAMDGENVLMWSNAGAQATALFGAVADPPTGTAAITCIFYNGMMQIRESDIVFNDRDWQWNTERQYAYRHVLSGLGPFALADEQTLIVRIDGGAPQTITFDDADFAVIGAATAREVRNAIIADLVGGTADDSDDDEAYVPADRVGIRSNRAYDGNHSVEIVGGTGRAALGFPIGLVYPRMLDVETIGVHELGHFLGIHHSVSAPGAGTSVMTEDNLATGSALKRPLNAEDAQALNFLYTPDLGDAPDPFGGPPVANEYPSLVHNPIPFGPPVGPWRMLNGRPLFPPALGPYHLFGFRGPPAFAGDRFEWLGDDMNDSPAECESLQVDMDDFDDGIDAPMPLSPIAPNRITVTIRHTAQPGRYVGGPRNRLYFNGYLDFIPAPNGVFDNPPERLLWWQGVPGVTVAASPTFVPPALFGTNSIVLTFDIPPVPPFLFFYGRYRLDYGEDEGRAAATPPLGWEGDLEPAIGAAQFGEVEDYPYQTYPDCNMNGCPDACETDPICCVDSCGGLCASDCNDNDLPDECEDCNGNLLADECDVLLMLSPDCDGNGVPDECELPVNDFNDNGIPDTCDIDPTDPDGDGEVSADCDGNGVPDEVEDCDDSGVADACEIAGGTLTDCNEDGVPDVCEPDCDGDGLRDPCDGPDCNANGVSDNCDIASGTATDCNANGVPDTCEDCNANAMADECDVDPSDPDGNGDVSADCNANGYPDECEFEPIDCNSNATPDECDIVTGGSGDCNRNYVPDECDIAAGLSSDCNGPGPDSTIRVSTSSAGTSGDASTGYQPALSTDARFVAFTSQASNLVSGDDNGFFDVFVRDRDSDADGILDEAGAVTTALMSVALDGASGAGTSQQGEATAAGRTISADGALVVFQSVANNLVAPAGTAGRRHIFVRNRVAGTTARINPLSGVEPNSSSSSPSISANGRYVAFGSAATNLGPTDVSGGNRDIYVKDLQLGTVVLVSTNSAGVQPTTGNCDNPAISATGRYVTWESTKSALVSGDTNSLKDVFRRDRDTDNDGIFDESGTISTVRVSVSSSGGQSPGGGDNPAISADGRWVAFRTFAAFVPQDTNGSGDVYVRDMNGALGSIQRVSVATGGGQVVGESYLPAVSTDGRYVAFSSNAPGLVVDDADSFFDVFVHDRSALRTILISRNAAGLHGGADSAYAAIADGNRGVVLHSNAALEPADGNATGDAYVRVLNDCDADGLIDALEDPQTLTCLGNGVPDECEADCNSNGRADSCDIATGSSEDLNGNGVPDECELLGGDVNCDGTIDFFDIDPFLLALFDPAGYAAAFPTCDIGSADCNSSGAVDFFDIDPFLAILFAP